MSNRTFSLNLPAHLAVAISAMLVAAAGCGSPPAVKLTPTELLLPSQWHEISESASVDDLWWQRLDPRLSFLVSEALQHNNTIEEAAFRLQAASAQARIAGAPQWPQFSTSGIGARREQNFVGFPLPAREQEVLSTTSNSFGVSLNVSWEVDLWGRLRAGQSVVLADLMASHADLAGARLSLIAQTARAYWATSEAQQQVLLTAATVDNARLSTDQVEARYRRGVRSALDLRLARSSQAVAEAVLTQRQRQLAILKRQLEILLGRYPSAEIEIDGELPRVDQPIPAGLPAELLARRPDLIAAERRLVAANARVSEARRALYPRISLTASGGRASGELSDLMKGDFSVWSLVGNLTQPLLQGGRLRARVDFAKASREQAIADFAQRVLRACGEVENALSAEGFLAEQEEALQRAADEALAARRLAEERYNSGLVDLISLLEAQRRAYETQSQLALVRRQRLDNRTDLHLALGGNIEAGTASAPEAVGDPK